MNKQSKKENSVKEKVVESKELSIDELLILGEKKIDLKSLEIQTQIQKMIMIKTNRRITKPYIVFL